MATGRNEMADTYFCKIVIAGDGAVGKTSLRERFMGKPFRTRYIGTLGADFATISLDINDVTLKYQIWDLAGQPKLRTVRHVYYLGAVAALLVFDITRRDTFENLEPWTEEIWKNNGAGIIPIIILGNKNDLRDEFPTCVMEEEALHYTENLSEKTKEKGFDVKYFNTSAKTGLNVSEAFEAIGKLFIHTLKPY